MSFVIPSVAPDPAHDAPETAPDGTVRLLIECPGGSDDLRVRVVADDGTTLAAGPVRCTSAPEPHTLALSAPSARAETSVRVLFAHGDDDEALGWGPGPLWIGAAPAVTKRATRRRRSASESDEETPKTTRVDAKDRREPEPARSVSARIGHTLDAFPDRVDTRDWAYHPRLAPLPDRIVNCTHVPRILDQGNEGACTGFALAAVINYLLGARKIARGVSPYMLYTLARRYDEWPGERYEGSSARGAMKGWVRHGVCLESSFLKGDDIACLNKALKSGRTVAQEALDTPGGAFYRVQHDQVRDVHAALAEVGVVYCTLMVHAGWDDPKPLPTDRGRGAIRVPDPRRGRAKRAPRTLPTIVRIDRATDGHAVAIVGYTEAGFIVQNSWGYDWGAYGFALLPYEDFLLHATDVWVMQLGVPVRSDLWVRGGAADTSAGLQRAQNAVPLDAIRPYVVDLGNNGELSDSGDYWTTEDDVERLFAESIPKATEGWSKRRILLYLHGGLNDERSVGRRVVAFREKMLANEVYPLHIMWESGATETLNAMLADLLTDVDTRAGGPADWLRRLRDNAVEAKDRTLELTLARPGGAMWREMKENARLASRHPDRKGGMQILCDRATSALAGLSAEARESIELHIVAHSAGSILAAYALPLLLSTGIPIGSLQLMAPAITVEEFARLVLPYIGPGQCPSPTLYALSDAGERDDTVGPYGKSLLFLVSNAFERTRGVPLLGMERFVSGGGEMKDRFAQPSVVPLFRQWTAGRPNLVIAGDGRYGLPSLSRSESHGGFDNDPDTMNSILARITGQPAKPAFEVRDLRY